MIPSTFLSCLRSVLLLSLPLLCLHPSAPAEEEAAGGGTFLIPKPKDMKVSPGCFELKAHTLIHVPKGDAAAREAGELLSRGLAGEMAHALVVRDLDGPQPPDSLLLVLLEEEEGLGKEGYWLAIMKNKARLIAAEPAGLFYGVQTLLQLLARSEEGEGSAAAPLWRFPLVQIVDQPRFSWRGLMMDASRTFQSKEYLERYIDLLAYYKMNVLHLHLTDDQGWRVEIKKHPRLTSFGARFAPAYEKAGGFYTQEDIREIVAYAAKRHVTVVPEIEMPGHCLAALATYPELSCSGGPFEIYPFFKGPGIQENVYCAGNEKVFTFLEEVIDEVLFLFPSEFIHVGGDEVPKAMWKKCPRCQERMKKEGLGDERELQSWFIRRMARYIESKGCRVIGWDEIMEGGLAENACVMSWRGVKPGMEALKAGHTVVFSPTSHCYFDYTYGRTPVSKTYSFEPVAEGMTTEEAGRILGMQANMWTHIAVTEDETDRMILPRLIALAEAAWSPKGARDFEEFRKRLPPHLARLEKLGIPYFDQDL